MPRLSVDDVRAVSLSTHDDEGVTELGIELACAIGSVGEPPGA